MSERDYDNEEQQSGRPGLPIDPVRIWNALRSRWHLIVIIGVVGAFLGAAIAKKLVGPRYAAHGVIMWTVKNEEYDPEEREAVIESLLFASNLDQVEKRLKLDMPTNELSKFVTVSSSKTSNNVAIAGEWSTAQGSAQLVNTVIDVFMESRKKAVSDRLHAVVQRYRDAVAEAEKRHTVAAQAYDDFRRESGITDIAQERELAIAQAAQLSAQADAARAQAEAAKSKLESLKAGGNASTGESNPLLTEADRRQAEADAKRLPDAKIELDRARQQYSSDHPNVRRLEAEIAGLEARIRAHKNSSTTSVVTAKAAAESAANRQRQAEEYQRQLRERLNKLSGVEGRAAVLLGELRVADEALDAAKKLLTENELGAQNPPSEFRVLERASPPTEALSSPRKRIALGFPIGFTVIAAVFVILWSLRKLDVRTPKEAAFWSNVPVVGASTWPRDPDMLSSLMHDLDDYAPHCEGVTLIVGASLDEAHLARRVAEWDGHRNAGKGISDTSRMLTSGVSNFPIMQAGGEGREAGASGAPSNMQILTLTGPVPAQALRRAARLADRVLVVVASGKHSIFQLMKIKSRLGREAGIGVLLVGLDKEYAMVRDRVGEIERFWHATRTAGG